MGQCKKTRVEWRLQPITLVFVLYDSMRSLLQLRCRKGRSLCLVCLFQPDAANIQCIVQTMLGGLACHTLLRSFGGIG